MNKQWTKKAQKAHRAKWVAALRSGEYRQARGALTDGNGFCCLGVACEISKLGYWVGDEKWIYQIDRKDSRSSALPEAVRNWLGLTTVYGDFGGKDLTVLNDDGRKRFLTIAKIIESEPEGLLA